MMGGDSYIVIPSYALLILDTSPPTVQVSTP